MGLSCIGPFTFAQEGTDPQNNQIQDNPIQEEHDTQNLEKLLKDYNKDAEKVLKNAKTLEEMNTNTSGDLSEEELRKVNVTTEEVHSKTYRKKIDPKDLKKVKYSEAMRVALEPLQKMHENQLVTILRSNTEGSSMAPYIERYPKLTLFAVRLIKEPEALPSLAKIVDDQDKLIRFGGIMLLTILVGFLLKRLMKKEGRSVLEALGFWFFRFLIMTSLRFGILIYFYGKEIEPTFSVAAKTFF